MSTVNAPVQNVGLYPDAVNPIQKNPYSSSVAAFGRLMEEPLLDPVAPVANTGPSSQTTHSDALREMFEFMSGNATFASPTVTPSLSTAVGTSSANSPSIDIQTGSDRKTNAGRERNEVVDRHYLVDEGFGRARRDHDRSGALPRGENQ